MDELVGRNVALLLQKKPTEWQSFFEPFSVHVSIVTVRDGFFVVKDRTGMSRSIPFDDEFMKVLDIIEV